MRGSMKVVVCWQDISGYMAACWRALAAKPGVELFIIARRPGEGVHAKESNFGAELLAGLKYKLIEDAAFTDSALIAKIVTEQRPDVIVISGWMSKGYRDLVYHPELSRCKFVMSMDTPWLGKLSQYLGRFVRGSYFKRVDRVVVAGERSIYLAKTLGFRPEQIRTGVYGFDFSPLQPVHARRTAAPDGWPKSFLFLGRYVPPKNLDVLLSAYTEYRDKVQKPWPLITGGAGPLKERLSTTPGIEDLGFVQPANLAATLEKAGVFVFPSRYEPWGVALAEAAASGLPLIASDQVSSAIDMLRPYYNGLTFASSDRPALTRALIWMHENHAVLPEWGARSQHYAMAYSDANWATRWHILCQELVSS